MSREYQKRKKKITSGYPSSCETFVKIKNVVVEDIGKAFCVPGTRIKTDRWKEIQVDERDRGWER